MRKSQIEEIGGIRGWAALVVFFWHAFVALDNRLWEYFDGPFMVLIFFALSGDALSVSFTRELNPAVSPTIPLMHVLRLTGLAIFCLWLTYLSIHWGLVNSAEAGGLAKEGNSQSLINPSDISLELEAFYSGLIETYRLPPRFIYFLRTMRAEFAGSIVVFAIGSVFPRLRFRPVILAFAILFYFHYDRHITLFIFGIFLGQCRSMGIFAYSHRVNALRALSGLAVLSFPFVHRFTDGPPSDSPTADKLASACGLLFCIYASKDAVWLFSTKVSYFLGEISFPLFALSSLVIGTLQSELIIRIISAGINSKATEWAVLCAATTGIVLIVFSCIVRSIERGYLRLLDKAVDFLVNPITDVKNKGTFDPIPDDDDRPQSAQCSPVLIEVEKKIV